MHQYHMIDGHCSHIIGLIKSLQGLKLHNFTHVPQHQSCTSLPQQWHIPRGDKIQPVPLNHVVVARATETRKRKPVICQFDTDYRLPKVTLEDWAHLQGLRGTPLANLTNNAPTTATFIGDVLVGSVLSYQTRNLKRKPTSTQQRCGDLTVNHTAPVKLPDMYRSLNTMQPSFDTTELEMKTRAQADSADWFIARSKRLTSSNFGKVLRRKAEPTTKFLDSLFRTSGIKAASLEYGKRNEINAKTKYLETYPDRHLHECGFVVNKEFDFLGASPDGKVCDDGSCGIIEVKCPYKARNLLIREACEQYSDFCLTIGSDNNPHLKTSNEYYAQVQGQLMVTGCQFCDFIVYTKKDLHVERITPDINFITGMLCKLAIFFKDYAAPYLKDRDTATPSTSIL